MKVITTVNIRLNGNSFKAGTELDLSDEKAKQLIASGQATEVAPKIPKNVEKMAKDFADSVALNKSYEAQLEELRAENAALKESNVQLTAEIKELQGEDGETSGSDESEETADGSGSEIDPEKATDGANKGDSKKEA